MAARGNLFAMNRPILASLRSRLLLLVFLAGLPSLGLVLRSGLEQRRYSAAMMQDNALRLARLAGVEQEQLVTSTRQFLMMLSQVPEVRKFDSAACNKRFAELRKQYPAYANIGAVRDDGTVYGSAIALSNVVNLADRPYIQRALETRDFAVGDYQIGRITRKPGINFGYPILDDEGKLQGVVFAAIDVSWLNNLARRANLPRGASLIAIDGNGTVLVSYPEPERWVGRKLREAPLIKAILDRHVGTAELEGLDGAQRLYGFMRLGRSRATDVHVAVGLPEKLAYDEVNRIIIRNLILLALVAALALAAAWVVGNFFIVRWVRVLVGATRRVTKGDLGARTNLSEEQGELGELGRAFDEMAVALEQRATERQRAVEALRKLNEELEQRVAARTSELLEKNEQMQSDLRMARELQLAFLPQKYPSFPRDVGSEQSALRFCHRYLPTDDIGGDFFDVMPLSDTEAGVFICDVMGHGVRAALVAATLRGLVGELSSRARDPSLFLSEINRALLATLRRVNTTMFASAFYLVADVASGQVCFANAGHPSPLHVRRSELVVESLYANNQAGSALGLFEDSVYPTVRRKVAADDLVVLYTDGLYEVYDVNGQQYGEERLLAALRKRIHLPCTELFDEVLQEMRRFSHTNTFADDVCLVGMEIARVGIAQQSQTVNEGTRTRL
jgi:serine phosphatase RsbU (regulator of sigma subunit)